MYGKFWFLGLIVLIVVSLVARVGSSQFGDLPLTLSIQGGLFVHQAEGR